MSHLHVSGQQDDGVVNWSLIHAWQLYSAHNPSPKQALTYVSCNEMHADDSVVTCRLIKPASSIQVMDAHFLLTGAN